MHNSQYDTKDLYFQAYFKQTNNLQQKTKAVDTWCYHSTAVDNRNVIFVAQNFPLSFTPVYEV